MAIAIGADIGGSHIVSCGVDLRSGALLPATRFERKLNRKGSREDIFAAWAEPMNQTARALGDRTSRGIGFAMPGAFNYRDGVALFTGNDKYECLYGVSIREELPAYLSAAAGHLRFINDATAFGVGSAFTSAAAGADRLVAITLGTGFGATFNAAGLPVTEGKDVPPHGSLWHLPFRHGVADEYFSTRWFTTAYQTLTGKSASGVREISARADTEPGVAGLFEVCGANLAEFLSPWLICFRADRLVIGGNIARAWARMEAAFRAGLPPELTHLDVQPSLLLEDAAILGAARLLDDRFWGRVKDNLPLL